MDYIDLKQSDLEATLRESEFSEEEIVEIKEDVGYYDLYILIKVGKNIGFLPVFKQRFEDPRSRKS